MIARGGLMFPMPKRTIFHHLSECGGLTTDLPDVTASSEAGAAKPSLPTFRYTCDLLGLRPPPQEFLG